MSRPYTPLAQTEIEEIADQPTRRCVQSLDRSSERLAIMTESNHKRLDAIERQTTESNGMIRDLMHIVVGVEGDNGLRGQVKDINKRLSGLEYRIAGYCGVLVAVVWMIDQFNVLG